jgi:hypothetical protein
MAAKKNNVKEAMALAVEKKSKNKKYSPSAVRVAQAMC